MEETKKHKAEDQEVNKEPKDKSESAEETSKDQNKHNQNGTSKDEADFENPDDDPA